MKFHISWAAGQKNGQINRDRNIGHEDSYDRIRWAQPTLHFRFILALFGCGSGFDTAEPFDPESFDLELTTERLTAEGLVAGQPRLTRSDGYT